MSTEGDSELRSFSGYVTGLLASGKTDVSPEAALLQWRLENLSPEERDEEVKAIQEALDDIAAGDRGIPAEEFLAELDAEFGIPHGHELSAVFYANGVIISRPELPCLPVPLLN